MALKFPLLVEKSSINQTCFACPAQWEAHTDAGEYVYIRYRWGILSVEVAETKQAWYDNDYVSHFCDQIGDEYDGAISWSNVKKYARIMEV